MVDALQAELERLRSLLERAGRDIQRLAQHTNAACPRCAELEAELAQMRKPGFDKKAYQREYMRRRRAKQG